MTARIHRTGIVSRAISLTLALACIGTASAQTKPRGLTEDEAYALARDAYLYAYPIVSMDLTMRQATNVPTGNAAAMRAPVNQFVHVRAYPGANDRDVARVNFDTLPSSAWLDLSRGPVMLSVPDTGGRYYLLQVLDMWSDVISVIGSRTTGTRAGRFAMVPPGWSGRLPQGADKIVAPTPVVWVLGRTQANGPDDYAKVHQVQDGFKLTPFGQRERHAVSPFAAVGYPAEDDKTLPHTQVNRMNGLAVLTRLATLMNRYPPHPNDYPILFRLRAFGVEPGKPFDPAKLDPALVRTINQAAKDALDDLATGMRRTGLLVNGWSIANANVGTYGTSYKRRAIAALGGLGAALPEDVIDLTAAVDDAGAPLTGPDRYVLHFDKGKLPPADAFWSITMYDKDGFQVSNPIGRFAIGDRDPLAFNTDGSLDIYVQAQSPGADRGSNWLPAPKDAPFQPTMRIYSPRREVADGTWAPPGFHRIGQVSTIGRSTR